MKYLKKFETEAEYEAYKNSADFIIPNVSYITSNNSVIMTSIYDTYIVTDGTFKVQKENIQ